MSSLYTTLISLIQERQRDTLRQWIPSLSDKQRHSIEQFFVPNPLGENMWPHVDGKWYLRLAHEGQQHDFSLHSPQGDLAEEVLLAVAHDTPFESILHFLVYQRSSILWVLSWRTPSWWPKVLRLYQKRNSWILRALTYLDWADLYARGLCEQMPQGEKLAHVLSLELLDATEALVAQWPDRLFEQDVWTFFHEEFTPGRSNHKDLVLMLARIARWQPQRLERHKLLRQCLRSMLLPFKKQQSTSYADLWTALAPTTEEVESLLPEVVAALESPQSKIVTTLIKSLLPLVASPQFPLPSFLAQVPLLLTTGVKQQLLLALRLLNALCNAHPEQCPALCGAALQVLMKPDEEVQRLLLRLLHSHAQPHWAEVQEGSAIYGEMLLSLLREEAAPFLQAQAPQPDAAAPAHSSTPCLTPLPEVLSEATALAPVSSIDELVLLAAQFPHPEQEAALYRFAQGVLTLDEHIEAQHLERFTPMLNNLLRHLRRNSPRYSSALIEAFALDYLRLLMARFPDSNNALTALYDKIIGKDQENSQSPYTFLNLEHLHVATHLDRHTQPSDLRTSFLVLLPLQGFLLHVLRRLDKQGVLENVVAQSEAQALQTDAEATRSRRLPLLSTPTHAPCYIAPEALAQRVAQYVAAQAQPSHYDLQMAMGRVCLGTPQEVQGSCELARLFRFLLGSKEAQPEGPFTQPIWWSMAALVKQPTAPHPALAHLPALQLPLPYLNGHYEGEVVSQTYGQYTYPLLRLHYPPAEAYAVGTHPRARWRQPRLALSATRLLPLQLFSSSYEGNWQTPWHMRQILWLCPNLPEIQLSNLLEGALSTFDMDEVYEQEAQMIIVQQLLALRHSWSTLSYRCLAHSLLTINKSVRLAAAALWQQRTAAGLLDQGLLGKLIAQAHAPTEWSGLRRLCDLVQTQLLGIAPQQDEALALLLSHLLAALPETPVRDTKKTLLLYAELLCQTQRPLPAFLRPRLEMWASLPLLRKVARSLLSNT